MPGVNGLLSSTILVFFMLTQSIVSSALESGIRGSVQLLLELGLVDEAKAVTEKFMARWISV